MTGSGVSIDLQWRSEALPGEAWKERFGWFWAAYKKWFLGEGDGARPDVEQSSRALAEFMPELVPMWERLVALSGEGEDAARMLSLYRPAPYLGACSQAVLQRPAPVLVRNYDYDPAKFEGVFLRSEWHGTGVVASTDCLWGVLDGVNELGLSVALSFGGRRRIGVGFGIPLILRYVLEFCSTTEEAVEVMSRVPSHMAYNVSVLDRTGAHSVVWMQPGGGVEVVDAAVCTNHQGRRTGDAGSRATSSVARERFLLGRIAEPDLTPLSLESSFLEPPLYLTDAAGGYQTLYTASYQPASGSIDYLWPGVRIQQSVDAFTPMTRRIELAPGPEAD